VNVVDQEIDHFLPAVYDELSNLSKEEIIKRFTALEFNHFLDYYRDAADLNRSGDRSDRNEGAGRYVTGERLFINVGKMDGLDSGKLLGLICDRTKISKDKVGKIDLKGAYSFFEIEKGLVDKVRDHLHGFDYKGRIVRIEVTDSRDGSSSKRDRGGDKGRGNKNQRKGRERDRKSRW
jgi:ATP-dependent RNA helicase DeaD